MSISKGFITHLTIYIMALAWCMPLMPMARAQQPAQADEARRRERNRNYLYSEAIHRTEINYRIANPATPTNQQIDQVFQRSATQALFASVQNDAATRVRDTVDAMGGINAQNQQGRTALMTAARGGEFAVVRALLAANADPNIQDNQGMRAHNHICADLVTNLRASGGQAVQGGRGSHCIARLTHLIAIALQGQESRINERGQIVADNNGAQVTYTPQP